MLKYSYSDPVHSKELKTNMDSNQNQLSEKEKINIIKKAFDKFKKKVDKIFKRQNDLFESIMKKISERKLDEQRRKIDEAYAKKVEEALRKSGR